jgi:hypothetical protein
VTVSNCVRALRVDIDLPYRFVKENFSHYTRVARFVLGMFGYRDLRIELKASPSNNAHVTIVLDKCVDPGHYHVLMWLLTDHHERIVHSMRRLRATGQILDFHYRRGAVRKRIDIVKRKCSQNPDLEVCRELER